VKTAALLGLVLLVAGAAALHRSAPSGAGREQVKSVTRSVCPKEWEGPRTSEAIVVQQAASESAPVERPAPPAPVPKPAAAVIWGKMATQMDGDVGLTSLQRSAVEELLKAREEEIKALHDGILRSGVIDIRRYDWETDLMKDAWYRKLDALLDREQHDRFVALVQKGFLNEGLSFTVQPGMTVLD